MPYIYQMSPELLSHTIESAIRKYEQKYHGWITVSTKTSAKELLGIKDNRTLDKRISEGVDVKKINNTYKIKKTAVISSRS